jgi:hypothetical protein
MKERHFEILDRELWQRMDGSKTASIHETFIREQSRPMADGLDIAWERGGSEGRPES